jgi:hypothetical protein
MKRSTSAFLASCVFFGASLTLFATCSGKDGNKKGHSSDKGDDPPSDVSGSLALGFPQDLVVTSPYSHETLTQAQAANTQYSSAIAGAGQLQVGLRSLLLSEEVTPVGFGTKRAVLAEQLHTATTPDACVYQVVRPMGSDLESDCFGPSITLSSGVDGGVTSYPGGDRGVMFQNNVAGEACTAAKISNSVDAYTSRVDKATGLAAMMICYARQSGNELPGDGETLDFMEFQSNFPASSNSFPFTFTSASMKRDGSTSDDRPIYETSLAFSEADAMNPSKEIKLTIRHVPVNNANTLYKGRLQMIENQSGQNKNVISITYDKTETSVLRLEGRMIGQPSTMSDSLVFGENGEAVLPTSNTGGTYAIFNINTSDGTGKIATAWVAGTASEKTRSFVAEVAASSGTKSGCGYFGFGASLQELIQARESALPATRTLPFINSFTCNWAGNNQMFYPNLAQRQCMTQNADTGRFVETVGNWEFSPQASCSGAGFTWTSDRPGYSGVQTPPATHDLFSITDTSVVTSPEVPDVGTF